MSKHYEVLRGLRGFGPEHWVHLKGLIEERDELLGALNDLLSVTMDQMRAEGCQLTPEEAQAETNARAAIAKATAEAA